jgi:septal ring factor EnvC (AmiA/AmiB activator)
MPSAETLAFTVLPDRDPELTDLIFEWITDRKLSAAERLIDQYLEKDLYLRRVIREQAKQLCANEDEMATYDDEEKALNAKIADLEARLAKLKPAPAPTPKPA